MPLTEEQKKYQKQYREKNKETRREYNKQYREKNKEKLRAKNKEYRRNNLEKVREQKRVASNYLNSKKKQWRSHGLKQTDEQIEIIYERWLKCDKCDLCGINFKLTNTIKQMEHCHISGCFRNFTCSKCNSNMVKVDRLRMILMEELHRYFIRNNL